MVVKIITSLFFGGAAWFLYQHANLESVPMLERFGSFSYMACFIFLGLWAWTRK